MYVVSEDWYFLSHRLPMARAARDCGFRVVVATRINDGADAIRAEGFEPVAIRMDRAGKSPLAEARTIAELHSLFGRYRPAIVHNVAIKPILDGGLAALGRPRVRMVNAFAGMGSLLGAVDRPSLLRRGILAALRRIGASPRATALVQNRDDRAFLLSNGLAVEDRLWLIPGSGVDIEAFHPASCPPPSEPIIVLMVSRLLREKGVDELIEAARELTRRGVPVEVHIAGDRDPANPNSVSEERLAAARAEGVVHLLGRRHDVADLMRRSHVAVLPTYYPEGLPKSLLEAAACGLPLVTTDVSGCRDLVGSGEAGLLVPPRNPLALADALQRLTERADERERMGRAARRMVEADYSDAVVARRIAQLYEHLLADSA